MCMMFWGTSLDQLWTRSRSCSAACSTFSMPGSATCSHSGIKSGTASGSTIKASRSVDTWTRQSSGEYVLSGMNSRSIPKRPDSPICAHTFSSSRVLVTMVIGLAFGSQKAGSRPGKRPCPADNYTAVMLDLGQREFEPVALQLSHLQSGAQGDGNRSGRVPDLELAGQVDENIGLTDKDFGHLQPDAA